MLFELNFGYYLQVFYEEDIDFYSKFNLANKLLAELTELIIVYCKSLYYTQKPQNQVHKNGTKARSYIPSNKI